MRDGQVGLSSYHGLMPVKHSVLNVKALVGAFNQEKALVGASSVIVKTDSETDGSSAALHFRSTFETTLFCCNVKV